MTLHLRLSPLPITALILVACATAHTDSGFDPGGSADAAIIDAGADVPSLGPFSDAAFDTGTGCQSDPANYDIPGDHCDNDGDGQIDNVIACDTGISANGDANDFAKAIGLCQKTGDNDPHWGVLSATYTNGHISANAPGAVQHGILPKFGNVVVPREGAMLAVLSSGTATEQDGDNGPYFKGPKESVGSYLLGSDAPSGYPKDSPGCPGVVVNAKVHDAINVKLVIRVPKNAKGFSFDFDFWSGEWPDFVCSPFNDSFVAFLSSAAFNGGVADNISFDAKNNPVSVNNGFFDRCTPNAETACRMDGGTPQVAACPGGVAELAGTGFEDLGIYCPAGTQTTGGGATGWLTSKAPVKPGETMTLELMIWDTGDWSYDSSVLVDHFVWQGVTTDTGTGRPPPK